MRPPGTFYIDMTAAQNAALGRMMLRWGQIDHLVANCILRLRGRPRKRQKEDIDGCTAGQRVRILADLMKTSPVTPEARKAFDAFLPIWRGLIGVRNHVAHGVTFWEPDGTADTKLQHRGRDEPIEKILAAESITNFAAHAVLSFRFALGLEADPDIRHPLPRRPAIPPIVKTYMKDDDLVAPTACRE